jgi:putative acetyltransferase
MTSRWTIGPLQPDHAGDLFAASEALMEALYPAESNHVVGPEAFTDNGSLLLGAVVGEDVIGCVGWVMTAVGEAEVKRLFVDEHYRSTGVGRALMEALHDYAADAGITVLRLETGIHQTPSIRLYESLGYRKCGPFGHYGRDPLSVFLEKRLLLQ